MCHILVTWFHLMVLHDVCKLDPSGSYPELTAELTEPDRGWRSGWLTAA